MTYYMKEEISSCEIAGAVADAAIHDLRINLFVFSGFPQISVSVLVDDNFTVSLAWGVHEEKFTLSVKEARVAVKKFRSRSGHHGDIFERIQAALVSLEVKSAR